jgi:hypothetical protein
VVAFLVAPKLDLTLAMEPVLSSDLREDLPLKKARHEGELTAALRLIDRLHKDYGCFIDAFALDGLYPCGPVFEKLRRQNRRNENGPNDDNSGRLAIVSRAWDPRASAQGFPAENRQ